MNDNKFHKKIEELLSEEEKADKAKNWQKIVAETGYSSKDNKEKPKSNLSFKWVSLVAAVLLIGFVATLSVVFIQNANNTYDAVSSSSPANNQSNVNSFYFSLADFNGTVSIEGEKKYFNSDDKQYHIEITENVTIKDFYTNQTLTLSDLSQGDTVVASIVVNVYDQALSPYNVGDLVKIEVK